MSGIQLPKFQALTVQHLPGACPARQPAGWKFLRHISFIDDDLDDGEIGDEMGCWQDGGEVLEVSDPDSLSDPFQLVERKPFGTMGLSEGCIIYITWLAPSYSQMVAQLQ